MRTSSPNAVFVSAATGAGLDDLLQRLAKEAARGEVAVTALVPYTMGDLVRQVHERGRIISEEYTPEGTLITARVPHALAMRLETLTHEAGGERSLGADPPDET